MRKLLKVGAAIAALSVVVAASALAAADKRSASDTLVFGAASDPVILDGPLVSDGESLRVIDQIFEGLVGLKPGTTVIEPKLAVSWKASPNGLIWIFNLRKNVKFQDGTPFNAAAVCANFDRWYSFPGPLQTDAVTYYWNTVFGGFKKPAQGSPGPDKSLYRGCKASGQSTAKIILNRRSSSFLGALALTNFGIASPTALKKYQADAGSVDADGVFHPTGTFGTQHPIGTGPFMLKSWKVGDRLELTANPNYWGPKPKLKRIIFRAISDNSARLQALQTGEIQGYDLVAPQDIATIKGSSKLKVLDRPAFNVGYVGLNQSIPPMNNILVRRAVAYGLDRNAVVKSFYSGRGEVADQFLPPLVVGFAKSGVPQYKYDPEKAKALLRQAGLTLPVKVDFWYPTNVSRPYMPDPKRNFEAFAASLAKAGFQVVPHSAPWRPDYLGATQSGKAQMFLLGWTGDFGDPANFLNVHFGAESGLFGFKNPALFDLLARADAETNPAARIGLYQKASVEVMKFLPMVPYVHSKPALAFQKNVQGYVPSPVSLESFATVSYSR
ncbi:ABC-type dipeptide transport system periplasmic component [Gaiella occulta]|uniref:ABC-type dipeptide transport system periplasmic component n=1 Tax=Gaiella occulta TaxID=1002870 RepID=A0A7M2YX93_9ACTN|nr:ABC transporter substrate-binding protein [Gaiella occulta]RDI74350.1 ABC-type dipeptide transport system periplasmic component [Gaiella occulta]